MFSTVLILYLAQNTKVLLKHKSFAPFHITSWLASTCFISIDYWFGYLFIFHVCSSWCLLQSGPIFSPKKNPQILPRHQLRISCRKTCATCLASAPRSCFAKDSAMTATPSRPWMPWDNRQSGDAVRPQKTAHQKVRPNFHTQGNVDLQVPWNKTAFKVFWSGRFTFEVDGSVIGFSASRIERMQEEQFWERNNYNSWGNHVILHCLFYHTHQL